MTAKLCFVIMPIGQAGTDLFTHFETVYDYVRAAVEAQGFETIRADEVGKSGAITKDIVTKLATADLVIADLTDLNPNVFYELGVRHALRGTGTLMVLDTSRTEHIPFDLSAYRVIKYKSDLAGIKSLTQGLVAYIEQSQDAQTDRDNPVHDWFPSLPLNVIDANSNSDAGDLRKKIKQLEKSLLQYEQAYGTDASVSGELEFPLSIINSALQDAKDGLLPASVMETARKAFEQKDVISFLERITIAIDRNIRLKPEMFIDLSHWAALLDLRSVQRAIFEQGLALYPSEKGLRMAFLGNLARSDDPMDRRLASTEIPRMLSFSLDDEPQDSGTYDSKPNDIDMHLVGTLLDCYQRDEMHEESLVITSRLMKRFPEESSVLRNHARALDNIGRREEALEFYKRAVLVPSADDTSAFWLGNEYMSRDDWSNAAEAYALSCVLDSSDAVNFARLSSALATGREKREGDPAIDQMSQFLTDEYMNLLYSCACSCPNMGVDAQSRFQNAYEKADLHLPKVVAEVPRAERNSIARGIHRELNV